MIPLFALLFSFYLIPDIATVVGYLVVSRPFLNLNNSAFIGKKHSFLMEVSQGKVNKNNNNNQFKKSRFTSKGRLKALPTLLPLITGP